jgi:predicted ribosome quality control (RQC) complex YloA/Tae2 family protein
MNAPNDEVDADDLDGPTSSSSSQLPLSLPFDMVDFSPFLFAQYRASNASYIIFPSFNDLCDEYFSRLDLLRVEKAETQARSAAEKRLDRIREGHVQSVNQLKEKKDASYTIGRIVEGNAELVDNACLVIRSALENSINWLDLEKLVVRETESLNPVASAIASLDLPAFSAVLVLKDFEAMHEFKLDKRRKRRALLGLSIDEDNEEDENLGGVIEDDDEDDDEDEENKEEEEEGGDDDDDEKKKSTTSEKRGEGSGDKKRVEKKGKNNYTIASKKGNGKIESAAVGSGLAAISSSSSSCCYTGCLRGFLSGSSSLMILGCFYCYCF